MARLILIRHGETDYSAQNSYCGFSNPSLNSKGRWQAKRLAVRLRDIKIEKVYSSDLKRAYETAEIIFKNSSIEKLSDFREMNFGVFEGLKYEEIIEKYPGLYIKWIDNPEKIKIPDVETLKDLDKRVIRRLSFILSQHADKKIALVTHGGPIRVILCNALRYSLKMFWQIEQEIGALNIIDYAGMLPNAIIKINDTSHLSVQEETPL